jgi:hypothetical protein
LEGNVLRKEREREREGKMYSVKSWRETYSVGESWREMYSVKRERECVFEKDVLCRIFEEDVLRRERELEGNVLRRRE